MNRKEINHPKNQRKWNKYTIKKKKMFKKSLEIMQEL